MRMRIALLLTFSAAAAATTAATAATAAAAFYLYSRLLLVLFSLQYGGQGDASRTRILHAAERKHVRAVNVTKVHIWVIA